MISIFATWKKIGDRQGVLRVLRPTDFVVLLQKPKVRMLFDNIHRQSSLVVLRRSKEIGWWSCPRVLEFFRILQQNKDGSRDKGRSRCIVQARVGWGGCEGHDRPQGPTRGCNNGTIVRSFKLRSRRIYWFLRKESGWRCAWSFLYYEEHHHRIMVGIRTVSAVSRDRISSSQRPRERGESSKVEVLRLYPKGRRLNSVVDVDEMHTIAITAIDGSVVESKGWEVEHSVDPEDNGGYCNRLESKAAFQDELVWMKVSTTIQKLEIVQNDEDTMLFDHARLYRWSTSMCVRMHAVRKLVPPHSHHITLNSSYIRTNELWTTIQQDLGSHTSSNEVGYHCCFLVSVKNGCRIGSLCPKRKQTSKDLVAQSKVQ